MAQNLTYTQCGDYNIPDIRLEHTEAQTLGKYGEQNNPSIISGIITNTRPLLNKNSYIC